MPKRCQHFPRIQGGAGHKSIPTLYHSGLEDSGDELCCQADPESSPIRELSRVRPLIVSLLVPRVPGSLAPLSEEGESDTTGDGNIQVLIRSPRPLASARARVANVPTAPQLSASHTDGGYSLHDESTFFGDCDFDFPPPLSTID